MNRFNLVMLIVCSAFSSFAQDSAATTPAVVSYDLSQLSPVLSQATLDVSRLSSSRSGVSTVPISIRGSQTRFDRAAVVFALGPGVPTNLTEGAFDITSLTSGWTSTWESGATRLWWQDVIIAKDAARRSLSLTILTNLSSGCHRVVSATLSGAPLSITPAAPCP